MTKVEDEVIHEKLVDIDGQAEPKPKPKSHLQKFLDGWRERCRKRKELFENSTVM